MPRFFRLLILLPAFALLSCEDELSSLGNEHFPDPATVVSQAFDLGGADTALATFRSYSNALLELSTSNYNSNYSATTLFVGRTATADPEVWSVLRFPVLSADTLSRVTSVRLVLSVVPFVYGASDTKASFDVYIEGGSKVTQATTSLTRADLSGTAFASFDATLPDSALHSVVLELDSSIRSQLGAVSLAFVVVPRATMTNVRAFGSSESVDKRFHPRLEYSYRQDTAIKTTSVTPSMDYSIVSRPQVTSDLVVSGGINQRTRIRFALEKLTSLHQNPFATINDATLTLRLDPSRSSLLNTRDTLAPAIVLLESARETDTIGNLLTWGERDKSDPTLYRFQVREMLEHWLRNPTQNFGFELRAGSVMRSFGTQRASTEDYSLNRRVFFGPTGADPAQRPHLHITYSTLAQ